MASARDRVPIAFVGHSHEKREPRGNNLTVTPCSSQSLPLAKAGGQALDPRFRGGDQGRRNLIG